MKNKIIFILFGILILFGVVYLINYSQKFADTTLKSPELNDGEEFVSDSKIEEVILNGEFETVIYDEKAPRYEYFIDNSGEKTQIYFTEPVFLSSGNLVNVKAKNIDGKLTAESKDVEAVSVDLAPPVVAQVPETISEQKTAVILVKFNDSSMLINPFTVQQINNTIFNGPIQNFIRENSFNQTWLSGNTYGWYTMNRSCNDMYSAGFVTLNEAISASDLDIYFPNIDRIIIISDAFCYSGPSAYASVGKTNLNSNDGQFRASYLTVRNSVFFYQATQLPSGSIRNDGLTSGIGLILHELGHNFGAWHSNNWDCGSLTLGNNCTYGNYGNIYDVMGKAWITGTPIGYNGANFEVYPHAAFHYSALMKKEFKWINNNNLINIVRNGTYTMRPLEKSQATIARVSLYQYPTYNPYFLEYRIPFGYDNSLNDALSRGNLGGIFINRQYVDFITGPEPQQELLDMTPTTSDPFDRDWYNVSLTRGRVFFDVEGGIKITNVSEDLSNPADPKVSFKVEFYPPTCNRMNPAVQANVIPSPPYFLDYFRATNGSMLNITNKLVIDAANLDGRFCSNSTFEFEANVSNGWNYRFDQPDVIIPQGQSSGSISDFFEIDIPANASSGFYNVSIVTKNVDSGLSAEGVFRIRVI